MKAVKIFKIVALIIGIIGLLIEIPILVWSIQEALRNQNLAGSARAQSEMFMIPMMIFGGPCSIAGLVLIIVNTIIDTIRKTRPRINIFVYPILIVNILIPTISLLTLVPLMYSGWK